jgi:hypothetical protein
MKINAINAELEGDAMCWYPMQTVQDDDLVMWMLSNKSFRFYGTHCTHHRLNNRKAKAGKLSRAAATTAVHYTLYSLPAKLSL